MNIVAFRKEMMVYTSFYIRTDQDLEYSMKQKKCVNDTKIRR